MASESEKICILLKSVGNAPVLKKDKFMLGKTTKLRHDFRRDVRYEFPGFSELLEIMEKLCHKFFVEKNV